MQWYWYSNGGTKYITEQEAKKKYIKAWYKTEESFITGGEGINFLMCWWDK